MNRVALFYFHKELEHCRGRIALLRRFNPGMRIFGLYGGEPDQLDEAIRTLGPQLQSIFCLRDRTPKWKWANTDLAVREWYRAEGCSQSFDVVHVIQWDLLLFGALDRLYAGISAREVGLTGLTPVESIAARWFWTTREPHRTEWTQLQQHAADVHGYRGIPFACQGPGYVLPRDFLAQYTAATVPELGHDELRLPLYAEVFGFPVRDTGFYPRWFDPISERHFNANSDEISPDEIASELSRPEGRRAFHPCRERFDRETLEALCDRAEPHRLEQGVLATV